MTTKKHKFVNFSESIRYNKKIVYSIARGRQENGSDKIFWVTIGTGFLIAPKRFITAGHVINNPEILEANHKDGDIYLFIQHDDEGEWHQNIHRSLILNNNIFVYTDVDLCIIYLEKTFYEERGKVFLDYNMHFGVDMDLTPIGSEVGVLGYPLCQLRFQDGELSKPIAGNMLLRCDRGIINCRYQRGPEIFLYEFTMSFNPGNSGGPIFDPYTGKIVSIVKGFISHSVKIREVGLSEEQKKQMKIIHYSEDSYIDVMHANYSLGFASTSFYKIFKEHGII